MAPSKEPKPCTGRAGYVEPPAIEPLQLSSSHTLPLRFRIFLSSPGDVADERSLALRIIKEELPYDPFLRGKVSFDAVSWNDPAAPTPMDAHLTPQEAINQRLAKPSECDAVVVILWSRMGTPLAERKKDGTQYLSGTEWEYEDALNAPSKPFVLVYICKRKVLVDADDYHDQIEQYERIKVFLARFKKPDGSLRAYKHYQTPSDFADQFRGDIRKLLQEKLEAVLPHFSASESVSVDAAPLWQGSPYPGLRTFSAEEASIFFGRGREVDDLILRLGDPTQRFISVIGSSGTGKSSLVRAGVIPRLRQNAVPGSKDWSVIEFTPGELSEDPFLPLAAKLYATQPPDQQWRSPKDIAKVLRTNPSTIGDIVSSVFANLPKWVKLLVFIDQFEELFASGIEAYAREFIHLLVAMVADDRIKIIFTLRGDFFLRSTDQPDLAEFMRGGVFTLAAPGPAAMRDMIIRPAERAGLALEEGLADAILADAGVSQGTLPLIAFALAEMYRISQPGPQLTCSSYDQMGRLKGAIAGRAHQVMSRLSVDVRAVLPRVFQALIRLDQDTATRRRVDRMELAADEPTSQLLDALITARLLQTDERDGHSIVEVAHEAVFEGWPELRDWIHENWRLLLQREDIEVKASRWASEHYDVDFLLPPGRQLEEAISLVEQWPDLLRPGMRAYVAASYEQEEVRVQSELAHDHNLFRPLRHEVRPAVNGLRERISKLELLSNRLEIPDNNLFRDFHLVISDIVRNAEELQRRLSGLLDQGQARNPVSGGDIIIEEAKSRATRHTRTMQDLHAHFSEIGNSLPRQRQKRHRFIYRGPRSVNIDIDPDTLREILRNLMDNAAKYCVAHDEIVGQVRAASNYLEFLLSNSGTELNVVEKARIFQKGFRGAQARRDYPTGRGLGLFYCRELCRLYDITLHYSQRKSSTEGISRHSFELLIPLARVEGY